ncbi:MAG: NAD(P)-dependent oxidoreductase [Candidatus Rariloculaceae bacterium]
MTLRNIPKLVAVAASFTAITALPVLKATAETIVVYGASGGVGSIIVDEALMRGHDVVGVSRNPAGLTNDHPSFSAVAGDITDVDSIIDVVAGADAVVISVNGVGPDNTPESAVTSQAAKAYIEAAGRLGDAAPHVIQVGGGTTLYTDGVWGLDDPELVPGTRRHGQYFGHWQAIEAYRASENLEWTVMSGSRGALQSGERTGQYRVGGEETLFNAEGSSFISTEDFAIAVIDEAETGQSAGQRVAVGPPY